MALLGGRFQRSRGIVLTKTGPVSIGHRPHLLLSQYRSLLRQTTVADVVDEDRAGAAGSGVVPVTDADVHRLDTVEVDAAQIAVWD